MEIGPLFLKFIVKIEVVYFFLRHYIHAYYNLTTYTTVADYVGFCTKKNRIIMKF